MKHLFLSDVHLGALPPRENRLLEDSLISLVRHCADQNIRIHLLGDLFDYWMEYPEHRPDLGERVCREFESYNRTVHSCTFVTGNHDNWTRGYFSDIGFNVEPDFQTMRLEGKSIFMHHGDGLQQPEFGLPRPLFHRLLRNRRFINLYQKLLPPDAGLHLMKTFSEWSRANPETNPERLNRWSASFLRKREYDVVISGHDHIPRMETFTHGLYINPGSFFGDRTAALYTNNRFQLVTWRADSQHFKPFNSPFEKQRTA